jgi:Protein of unknown function (DUF4199)
MNKIIWVYGTIAGLIMGAMFFITDPLWDNGMINFDNGMWVGYTTMVIALSLIFFGIKTYRDNKKEGVITFGHAFKVGILITLVASVLYVASWEVALKTVSKEFPEVMKNYYLQEARKEAKNEQEAKAAEEKIKQTMVMYANPVIRFGFTFIEVFPVGLVITLVSAGMLRRKEFLP